MLCPLIRLANKIADAAVRAMRAAIRWLSHRLRQLWTDHIDKVSDNPAYAAAAGAVIGGLLGFVSPRDVAAAVLTALLGVYVTGAGRTSNNGRADDPWDLG